MQKRIMAASIVLVLTLSSQAFAQIEVGDQRNSETTPSATQALTVQSEIVSLSEGELTTLVRRSSRTLTDFETLNGGIPKALLANAKCVGVFPSVKEVAVVVGGRHGDGVATCRGTDGKWSRIGFLDLTGASFGAQIGAKETALVLLFMNDKAQQSLTNGKITLGADLSVAAGESTKVADVNTAAADIIAYANSAGAFVGAALNGTIIKADEDELKAFYKEPITLKHTFSTSVIPTDKVVVSELIKILPPSGAAS